MDARVKRHGRQICRVRAGGRSSGAEQSSAAYLWAEHSGARRSVSPPSRTRRPGGWFGGWRSPASARIRCRGWIPLVDLGRRSAVSDPLQPGAPARVRPSTVTVSSYLLFATAALTLVGSILTGTTLGATADVYRDAYAGTEGAGMECVMIAG